MITFVLNALAKHEMQRSKRCKIFDMAKGEFFLLNWNRFLRTKGGANEGKIRRAPFFSPPACKTHPSLPGSFSTKSVQNREAVFSTRKRILCAGLVREGALIHVQRSQVILLKISNEVRASRYLGVSEAVVQLLSCRCATCAYSGCSYRFCLHSSLTCPRAYW